MPLSGCQEFVSFGERNHQIVEGLADDGLAVAAGAGKTILL